MYWWIQYGKHKVLRVRQLAPIPWLMKEQEQAAFFIPNYKLMKDLCLEWLLRCNDNRKYERKGAGHTIFMAQMLPSGRKHPGSPSYCAHRKNTRQNLGAEAFTCSSVLPPDRNFVFTCPLSFSDFGFFSRYSLDSWSETLPIRALEEGWFPWHS